MGINKIKEALKEAVGKGRDKESPSEKKQAAAVREKTENLMNVLRSLSLTDATGKIPKEAMESYKSQVTAMAERLDRASASVLDTRRLDREMAALAQRLDAAVKDGCQETAERIIKALLYGVGKGHAPVSGEDSERVEEILEERENRLRQYKTVVEFSERVDERQRSIELQQKEYEDTNEAFEKKKKEIAEFGNKNPHLVALIKNYGGSVKNVDPGAFALLLRQQEAYNLFKSMEALKEQMSMSEAAVVSCRQIIRSEEEALAQLPDIMNDELRELVKEHEEAFRKRLLGLRDQIIELGNISNRFNDAIQAVFTSPVMEDYAMEINLRYDDLLKKLEEEERMRAEGRRLLAEQEQSRENSQRQEQILN